MALVLTIYLLASLSQASSMEIITSLAYIGITLLQALVCYTALKWPRNAKHVNYHVVVKTIQDRLDYHEHRRGEGKELVKS